MRRKLIFAALATGALAIGVINAASAFGPGGGPGFGGDRPLMSALHQLDLSSKQRSSIRSILQSHRSEAQAEHEQMHGQMTKFLQLDPTSATYSGDVQALADTAADNARARTASLAAVQKQVYAVLTADQRSKLPGLASGADLHHVQPMIDAHVNELLDELNLTDTQWLAIHKIQTGHRADAEADRAAMKTLVASFLALDPTAPGYDASVTTMSESFATSARDHVNKFAAVQKEVYGVLTADQRSKLINLVETRSEKHMHQGPTS